MAGPHCSFENGCMSTGTDRHTSVETAISRVLAAEREALAEIAACENRAEQLRREARAAVRAMVRRTQDRISRLHAGCAARTAELVAELQQDAGSRDSLPGEDQETGLLLDAVRAVAAELTAPEDADAN
jgi:RNA polymerase-interacting CarD/CdnL/TRCF family regulator